MEELEQEEPEREDKPSGLAEQEGLVELVERLGLVVDRVLALLGQLEPLEEELLEDKPLVELVVEEDKLLVLLVLLELLELEELVIVELRELALEVVH